MTLYGIIFDLDGTLADTMDICVRSLQETIVHFVGNPLPEAELYARMGPTEEGILRKVLGERGPSAYSHLLEIYERLHQDGRWGGSGLVFPGVVEMLEALRARGLRLAIATGKGAETAAISLRYSGLGRYVERVETGFLDRANKPELIRRVLEGWDIEPAGVAYVGDMPSDMHAAREAGVLPLGAAWAETSLLRGEGLPEDWLLFRQVEDLTEWIGDS